MSTPRTLAMPASVAATHIVTSRGAFAAHIVRPTEPIGHVLLVPGWTGSKEDFTQLLPYLAEAGFDATAYDQRGQFETPGRDDDDYSLSGFAADAAAVATAISAAEPVHLLGHSFGGLVAQSAVAEHPTAWRSLSLLCTGPGAVGESETRPLSRMVEALDALPMTEILRIRQRLSNASNPPDIEAFLEAKYLHTARASLKAMTQLLRDAPDHLDEVTTSGLRFWVGYGSKDDAWPLEIQAEMAHRLGIEPVVLDGLGHSPAVEDPQALATAWLPFLLSST